MANPQKDNGYTAIANEIMDALIKYRIPGEQRQCLDFIIRKTYGYNKKSDMISNSQFVAATGLKKPTVCRALNALIHKNIVIKKDNKNIPIYQFNKDYHTWEKLSKKITVIKKDNQELSKKIPTKDNITKDNIADNFYFKKSVKIPSDIFLTNRMKEYAKKQGCDDDKHIEFMFENFKNWFGQTGKKYQDWTKTFFNWVLKDKKEKNPKKYKKKVYV